LPIFKNSPKSGRFIVDTMYVISYMMTQQPSGQLQILLKNKEKRVSVTHYKYKPESVVKV
jgi:hypothetical protein